jgi:hypothetical protein
MEINFISDFITPTKPKINGFIPPASKTFCPMLQTPKNQNFLSQYWENIT